jgi:hypothetical protein
MKRLLLICGLALVFAVPAANAGTISFSGTAASNAEYEQVFDTSTAGDISVSVRFTPKTSRYWLSILQNVGTTASPVWKLICWSPYDTRVVNQPMPLICTVTNAGPGQYMATFALQNGKVAFTGTITSS